MGAARGSGEPHGFTTPCPHAESSKPSPPRTEKWGHHHPHTGGPPPRDRSHLPPALSSSLVLSLLPETQVSTELLFKIN